MDNLIGCFQMTQPTQKWRDLRNRRDTVDERNGHAAKDDIELANVKHGSNKVVPSAVAGCSSGCDNQASPKGYVCHQEVAEIPAR